MQYEPRGPIKGQVDADFMVELMSEISLLDPNGFQWVLFVNGSSNQQGSEARVILEGPNRLLIEIDLKFAFKKINTQVEYEALIARMLLAKELGAKEIVGEE